MRGTPTRSTSAESAARALALRERAKRPRCGPRPAPSVAREMYVRAMLAVGGAK